ncbi:MAG: Cyclopropane-fatty-acyl-phospholipid synthase [Actinomycetia bacterium]|nr:Cyclopropane-fatty-acyl-phospholipid synthase [Actinomycetes bacterium]
MTTTERPYERLDPAPVGVAATLRPLLTGLLGEVPVKIEFWDGSHLGPERSEPGTIHVRSLDAIRRVVWAPDELGVSRAFVAGDVDFDGDVFTLIRALRPAGMAMRSGLKVAPAALAAARELGVLSHRLPPPPEEAHPKGWRHSKRRDAQAISHHYDVGNDFYSLVLGPAMTYSCARFARPDMTLVEAQASKHELISRKLGLHERREMRLLDVGCGWGSMAIHAAANHGAHVVGVTISKEQAARARQRVTEAGLDDRVEIRLQDYRDLRGERFDAISSVGMFEHVGQARMSEYFATLHDLLHPTGRLLNHAISSVGGSKLGTRTFVYRYVFPDGELIDVGDVQHAMQDAGFEVRDVESLREHYATTLRHWVANLEEHWDEAVALVGEGRARIWKLYMAGSAIGFEDSGLSLHQVLGVRNGEDGLSAMPATRDGWVTA